jgi:hypothetical protein
MLKTALGYDLHFEFHNMGFTSAIVVGVGGVMGAAANKSLGHHFSGSYTEVGFIAVGMLLAAFVGNKIGMVSFIDMIAVLVAVIAAAVSFMAARHHFKKIPIVGHIIAKILFNSFVETLWLVGIPVLIMWLLPI